MPKTNVLLWVIWILMFHGLDWFMNVVSEEDASVQVMIALMSLVFWVTPLWWVTYSRLKTIMPDTSRSIGFDFFASIFTGGLFMLYAQLMVLLGIRKASNRLGVECGYGYMIGYYISTFLSIGYMMSIAVVLSGYERAAFFGPVDIFRTSISSVITTVLDVISVYCLLRPFEVIYSRFKDVAPA